VAQPDRLLTEKRPFMAALRDFSSFVFNRNSKLYANENTLGDSAIAGA